MDVNPLSMANIRQGRGELFAELLGSAGSTGLIHLGNVTAFSTEIEADETPVYSSNLPRRAKIGTLLNEVNAAAKFTTQSLTRDAIALALMGAQEVHAEAEDALFTKTFADPAVGRSYDLGRVCTGITVTDGAAVEYVAGTHYKVTAGRIITILEKPATADDALEVAGTATAIVGGIKFGIASNTQQRVKLLFRGVEAGKDNCFVEIWSGLIKPDGEVGFIGENDAQELSFTVAAEAVEGKPEGYEYGQVTFG